MHWTGRISCRKVVFMRPAPNPICKTLGLRYLVCFEVGPAELHKIETFTATEYSPSFNGGRSSHRNSLLP